MSEGIPIPLKRRSECMMCGQPMPHVKECTLSQRHAEELEAMCKQFEKDDLPLRGCMSGYLCADQLRAWVAKERQ